MGSSDACFTYQALVNNPYPLESVRAEFESVCHSYQVRFRYSHTGNFRIMLYISCKTMTNGGPSTQEFV